MLQLCAESGESSFCTSITNQSGRGRISSISLQNHSPRKLRSCYKIEQYRFDRGISIDRNSRFDL